ncbi:hypothetical protein [Acidimangrovimonas pyrenivorans]|uniref:Hemerythrin-like domain-containing protein n=1 Tax=Acidimangrovimonas pyrenivorans TaxID=2030798 RepID=A0ABV7AJE6_9RHOB
MTEIPSPRRMGHGGGGPHGPDRARRHRHDQQVFHTLLARHDEIAREVIELPDGVLARTTSEVPEVVALLHDHVAQMQRRLTEGFGLRHWDPAFREIFAAHNAVRMQVTRLADGVEVRQTSDDANIVLLLRAHAAAVSGFVHDGSAGEETPLPEDYVRLLS